MLTLPAIRANGFALVPLDGSTPAVKLSGNADAEAISPLDRFLKLLHKNLTDEGCTSVVVDLGELYFMNSSCLKAFVSWIYKVNTTGRPYQIRLQMNPRQPWQRRSLEPLKRLAPSVVSLDEVIDTRPKRERPGVEPGREVSRSFHCRGARVAGSERGEFERLEPMNDEPACRVFGGEQEHLALCAPILLSE